MVELEVFWPKMPSGGPQNGLLLPQLQFFTFFSLKLTNFDKNGLQNPLLPQVNSLYMECGSSTDHQGAAKVLNCGQVEKKEQRNSIYPYFVVSHAGFMPQISQIDPESPFLVSVNGFLAETH